MFCVGYEIPPTTFRPQGIERFSGFNQFFDRPDVIGTQSGKRGDPGRCDELAIRSIGSPI